MKHEFDMGMKTFCRQNPKAEACGGMGTEKDVKKPSESKVHSVAEAAQIEKDLGFNPEGSGEMMTAALLGFGIAGQAQNLALEARAISVKEYGEYGNSTVKGINDEEDAFRHTLASLMVSRAIGVNGAKSARDAHERSAPNPQGERVMDLFNNHMGRQLATNPANAGKPAADVVRQALADAKLMTGPLKINAGPGIGTAATPPYNPVRQAVPEKVNPYKK